MPRGTFTVGYCGYTESVLVANRQVRFGRIRKPMIAMREMALLRAFLIGLVFCVGSSQKAYCGDPDYAPETAIARGPAPSSKNSVCSELRDHKVKFFSYSYMNALPAFDIRDGPARGLDALDGMAKIDLNNDGNLLNVVRLEHPYCPSDGTTSLLAVTDETRTKIPQSQLNDVLIADLTGGKPCGLTLRAFSLSGTTYIDADRMGDHVIYEIQEGRANEICSASTFEIYE